MTGEIAHIHASVMNAAPGKVVAGERMQILMMMMTVLPDVCPVEILAWRQG